MDEAQTLLNYWYNLEFFSPFWPEKNRTTVYISKVPKLLPWLKDPDRKYSYDVYLGKVFSKDLIIQVLESIGEEDNVIERDNSPSCICAFKVTFNGEYIANSFSVSPFVWAVARIIRQKSLKTDLTTSLIDNFNNQLDNILVSIGTKIEYTDLKGILGNVLNKLLLSAKGVNFIAHINKKPTTKDNNKIQKMNDEEDQKEVDIDISTDMLPSFYTSDIDMIRRNLHPGDQIEKYIEALKKPTVNRVEIDAAVSHMEKWLAPENYPLGKWPSRHSPSLMQQIAINIAISENKFPGNIFSINGPPGTGKTTLLKEIVASNVVERALLLCEFKKADDVFQKCQFVSPENDYLKYYYQLDNSLTKYGIIVASNNNAAVENISIELPLAEDVKESNTTLFNIDESSEIYFSAIAKTLMGDEQECWGLISAPLGKKANIRKFKETLWFNEVVNLRELYKGEIPNWEQAKESFRNKHAEVIQYRKLIKKAVKDTTRHNQIKKEYNDAIKRVSIAQNKMVKQKESLNQKQKNRNNTETQIQMLSRNCELLNNRLPFFKRLFLCLFKKDPIVSQINQIKKELDSVTIKLTIINSEISTLQIQFEKLKDAYEVALNYCKNKETLFLNSSAQIKKYKEAFGPNFIGEEFWTDIEKNETSQIACPWTNKQYDTLREELFYYALILQKAFVLNSRRMKQNMNCLVNMWNNKFLEQDKALGYSHLLNTLFLIVPVISTTFAAVATFLNHIGKNELGILIIDEAGQATPQSSLGALWRTKKAIIVGDPLQVQPIVTVPKELCKRFAEEFEIDDVYKPQNISVQVLADSINPYGGYREYSGSKNWLGCPLVIHRRCLDPMFSISNKIAYNNRMFKKSVKPDENLRLLLKKSKWIDIKGKENGGKDHFVPEQGDKVIEMVLNAIKLQKEFPNIYIISPFKSVINKIKELLIEHLYKHCPDRVGTDINSWVDKVCGTVHTFQGKEANEVILVLGCDRKSGAGAADWAGKEPNILNVAVTRAKYRIAIIGDSELWGEIPNFNFAYKILHED